MHIKLKHIRSQISALMTQFSGKLQFDIRYFARGSFWLSLLVGANNLFGFLRSIIFARFLVQEVYGQFGFVNDIVSIFGIFSLPGLSIALIETVARKNYGTVRTVIAARLRWSLIATVCVSGVSGYYFFTGDRTLGLALLLSGLLQPFAASFQSVGAYYNGRKDFRKVSFLRIGDTAINLVALTLVIFLSDNLIWLILVNYASQAVYYFIIYRLISREIQTAPVDPGTVPYGRSLSWARSITGISNYLESVILGASGGFVDVAILRVASFIPKSAKNFLVMPMQLFMPKIAEHPEKRIYSTATQKKLLTLLGANIFFMSFLAVLLPIFIPLAYGEQYQAAVWFGQLFLLSLIFGWPNTFFVAALQARKQTRAVYIANLIDVIFQTGTLFLLAPFYGLLGVAISRILSRWLSAFYRWYAVSKI